VVTFDLVRYSIAAWRALGRREPVAFESLLLDAVRGLWREGFRLAGHQVNPWLHDPTWRPGAAIVIAVAWAAVALWLLHADRR
jgi:hypothetical protein